MSKETINPVDIMTMSDEDFNSLETQTETVVETETETNTETVSNTEVETKESEEISATTVEQTENTEYNSDNSATEEEVKNNEPSNTNLEDSEKNTQQDKEDKVSKPESTTDAQAFYDSIINVDIKANGGKIKLEKPEDAIKLIQLGANYTKKMQQLAPHRAVLHALEKHGMTEPDLINQLIDINSHNKDAIKALIQRAGLTSKDLFDEEYDDENLFGDGEPSTKQETEYKPSGHVQDIKVFNLNETITDAVERFGIDVVKSVDTYIDEGSYEMLKESPEDLVALAEQSQSGVLNLINDKVVELEKSGVLDSKLPYLQKYRIAGNMLVEQGKNQPLETRVGGYENRQVNKNIKHAEHKTSGKPKSKTTYSPSDIMTMSEEKFAEFDKETRNLQF